MGKLNSVWAYLRRHKYLITIIIGLMMIGIVDENSFRVYVRNQLRINELNEQIEAFEEQYVNDSVRLHALQDDPKGVERVARERYLMKRDNEDLYLIVEDAN